MVRRTTLGYFSHQAEARSLYMPKRLGPAGQQDNLHPLRGVRENVRHHLEAIVVRVNQSIVEHD
jgi:hypothetical protein